MGLFAGETKMPREIRTTDDPNEVRRLARERQEVEAQFARTVLDVFDSGLALQKLQRVAQALMGMMAEGPFKAIDKALKMESKLRLYDKVQKNASSLKLSAQSPVLLRKLDATDCADVIRLAGAWVESGGLCDGDAVKTAFRPGETFGEGLRVRKSGRYQIPPHLVPYMRDPNAFAGMTGKRAVGTSSVLQLDRLFGLVVACDISGTTADCVFALEVVTPLVPPQLQMTAAYYMLPLGTIAANMHHSLLEVALVLSLNEEADYHIGFFSTLKPKRAHVFPPELGAIEGAMAMADDRMKRQGLHHLCYYEGDSVKGVFQFQGAELIALRNSPISDAVEMLSRAQCLGGYPQRHAVVELLRSGGFVL
jgi:hypothetical protein